MDASAIQIQSLTKRYGDTLALAGIDLELRRGEFFGLLGPNGAGKTTLISCIVGLAQPSSGELKVFGHSLRTDTLAAKRCIGFSPQDVNVERFFNLQRTLEFQGGFYGLKIREARQRASELLAQFGLSAKAKQPFYKLSGGMQKRFSVARALMGRPQLLILDEPTAGVDVEQRHELWSYLQGLNRDGTTILLTTHYMDEAEVLCERVGMINHGKILELGSPKSLIAKYCQTQLSLELEGEVGLEEFKEMPQVRMQGHSLYAESSNPGATFQQLLGIIQSKPDRRIVDLNVKRGDLEEVFLKVTGKEFRAA